MKTILQKLICGLLISLYYGACAQGLDWVGQLSGAQNVRINDAATDASGYTYLTGSFEGVADFNPGPAIYNLTSNGGTDIFIAKFNAIGNLVWAYQLGSVTSLDEGTSIAVSPLGYIYIAGRFSGTADFYPGTGVANLTAATATCGAYGVDAFILKLDANGTYQWAHAIGGTGLDEVHDLAVGPNESVHLAGKYQIANNAESVDFNPGTGSFLLTSPGQLTAEFILKLSGNGTFVWAKQFTSSCMYSLLCTRATTFRINALAIDAKGRIYAAGNYYCNVDADPGSSVNNLPSTTIDNGFILKLQPNGNFLWAKTFTGGTNKIMDITLDAWGCLYATGFWTGTVDFDPTTSAGLLTTKNNKPDAFVVKLTPSGGLAWVEKFESTQVEAGLKIKVDDRGNVYTIGQFNATTDFDPSSASYKLTSAGGNDVYIAKLNANGKFVWAKAVGGIQEDYPTCLTLFKNHVFVGGSFYATADLDPGSGIKNFTSAGGTDGFLLALDQSITAKTSEVNTIEAQAELVAYPNPTSAEVHVTLPDEALNAQVTLINLQGQVVYSSSILNSSTITINVADMPAGIYVLRVTNTSFSKETKLIKHD